MANVTGSITTATFLTPLLPGVDGALRHYLTALCLQDRQTGGLFERVGSTHVARWVIVDGLTHSGPPERPDRLLSKYLLFTAIFDGTLDAFFDRFLTEGSEEIDAIWRHCVGYPGLADRAAFSDYLRRNRVNASLFYAAENKASVADVQRSLALRERLIQFVQRAQRLDAAALQQAYLAEFGVETTADSDTVRPADSTASTGSKGLPQ